MHTASSSILILMLELLVTTCQYPNCTKKKGIDETSSNHKDVSDAVLLTQTCQNNRKHLLSILVTVNTLIKSAGGH